MPLDYRIESERRLVVITGEYAGSVEWLQLAARLLRDPRLEAGFSFLRDLRGARRHQSAASVIAVFRVVQRFWPNVKPSRGAIVTDEGDNAAAQVAQALADTHDLPI